MNISDEQIRSVCLIYPAPWRFVGRDVLDANDMYVTARRELPESCMLINLGINAFNKRCAEMGIGKDAAKEAK